MNRRGLLGGVVAGIAAGVVTSTATAEARGGQQGSDSELASVHRIEVDDTWVRVRMQDLRVGDWFHSTNDPYRVYVVLKLPTDDRPPGVWGVECEKVHEFVPAPRRAAGR